MKRRKLQGIVDDIAKRFEQKELVFWNSVSFPYTFEEVVDEATIQVELELLEDEPDYLHISVSVSDDNWLRNFLPMGRDFLVKKSKGK